MFFANNGQSVAILTKRTPWKCLEPIGVNEESSKPPDIYQYIPPIILRREQWLHYICCIWLKRVERVQEELMEYQICTLRSFWKKQIPVPVVSYSTFRATCSCFLPWYPMVQGLVPGTGNSVLSRHSHVENSFCGAVAKWADLAVYFPNHEIDHAKFRSRVLLGGSLTRRYAWETPYYLIVHRSFSILLQNSSRAFFSEVRVRIVQYAWLPFRRIELERWSGIEHLRVWRYFDSITDSSDCLFCKCSFIPLLILCWGWFVVPTNLDS